jgi:UDP:flavonoid glycosyltransferase YjiC (YdhE family)
MHAILGTLGTEGDILPFAALGRVLRRRGHRVTLLTSDKYAPLATACGLDLVSLLDQAAFDKVLYHPDFWHPLKCALVVAAWGAPHFRRHYELLRDLLTPDTVLVCSPGIIPARFLEEQRMARLITVVLQPWMIKSNLEPPIMPAGLTLPRWAPRAAANLYWRMLDFSVERIVGGQLNSARRALGLPPVHRIFDWWLSRRLVVGLFPSWYAPPQADWPRQLRLSGFPLFDGEGAGVVRITHESPIVYTFGTGMTGATELFAQCAAACELLKRPGLFLTRHPRQLPTPLPAGVRHIPFAPLRELLPNCTAIVHHGGIGTTAAALAAGTPQLILPFAYDQFDNAARVERLGVGASLPPRRRAAADIAAALKRILCDPAAQRCRATAQRLADDGDSLTRTVQWIEEQSDHAPCHPAGT